jgi:hypothetical protein
MDAVSSACATTSQAEGGTMTEYRKVTREELDQLANEELPERAAMSLINANVAVPVNAAVAANVLSDQSVASADATQDSNIRQTNLG